jgi:hypothetical protein
MRDAKTICAVGIDGCTCDSISDEICDLLDLPRGTVNEFCECHDCYVCGEIECDGHVNA